MYQRTEQEIMQNWKGDTNTPLVSICTITYNHEKYIAEALDSFLMQETDFPFEIIVDEDCSLDSTAEIIKEYLKKFPSIIKAKLREINIGGDKNFIENVQRSKGKYIALCEGDDYWTDKRKLQYQIEKMKEFDSCQISFHPAKIINDQTITDKVISRHSRYDKIYDIRTVIKENGGFCPTASIIVKKEVMDNFLTYHRDRPVGDYFLQVLGSEKGGALYIDKTMSIYRVHQGGAWTFMEINFSARKKFVFEMISALEDMDLFFNFQYSEEIKFMKSEIFLSILRQKKFSMYDRMNLYKTCKHNMSDEHQIIWLDSLVNKIKKQQVQINNREKTIQNRNTMIQNRENTICNRNNLVSEQTYILNNIRKSKNEVVHIQALFHPIKKYKAYKNLIKQISKI